MAEGSVPRKIVVEVLKANGVDIAEHQHGDETSTTLIKGEVVEVQYLPERVPRRLVMRLGHKFGVPRHYFWHPEMMREDQRQEKLPPS